MTSTALFVVTLREWLESQRLQDTPHRAALNASMNEGDTTAIRRLLDEAPFSPDQRRYLDDLLDRWQKAEAGDD
ncbi:MAG: hypothetical protein IH609_17650 [Dehalococcoidia bacterium]|nr:hypothetical protein [Dehalococcoidia bacterium]